MRMRQIVICGLPRALQYFSTLSHKTTWFSKKQMLLNIKYVICFDFLCNFCLKHVILRRNERDVIKNIHSSSSKVTYILVGLQRNLKQLLSQTCHSKKEWERRDQKYTFVFTQSNLYPCRTSTKSEFSRQSFKKYSDIECHENLPRGSRVVASGRACRSLSHFSKFCDRV
jgi:hypothetical protein